jgi:cell division protein FtsX
MADWNIALELLKQGKIIEFVLYVFTQMGGFGNWFYGLLYALILMCVYLSTRSPLMTSFACFLLSAFGINFLPPEIWPISVFVGILGIAIIAYEFHFKKQ